MATISSCNQPSSSSPSILSGKPDSSQPSNAYDCRKFLNDDLKKKIEELSITIMKPWGYSTLGADKKPSFQKDPRFKKDFETIYRMEDCIQTRHKPTKEDTAEAIRKKINIVDLAQKAVNKQLDPILIILKKDIDALERRDEYAAPNLKRSRVSDELREMISKLSSKITEPWGYYSTTIGEDRLFSFEKDQRFEEDFKTIHKLKRLIDKEFIPTGQEDDGAIREKFTTANRITKIIDELLDPILIILKKESDNLERREIRQKKENEEDLRAIAFVLAQRKQDPAWLRALSD